MHTQPSMPASRGFTLIEIIVLIVIAGVLAAVILPKYTNTGSNRVIPPLEAQLMTIQSQIELYNVQNPQTPYDATTPADPVFWDPLLQGHYMETAPTNELQNNSSLVVASPRKGAGWVWAEGSPGDPWTLTIHRIDRHGNLYDGDKDGLPD